MRRPLLYGLGSCILIHVIDFLNRDGVEDMLTAITPQLRARGIECDIIALVQTDSPLEHLFLRQDICLHCTSAHRLNSPQQRFSVARVVRGYDIVCEHPFPGQLWTVLVEAGQLCPTPLATTEHNT